MKYNDWGEIVNQYGTCEDSLQEILDILNGVEIDNLKGDDKE